MVALLHDHKWQFIKQLTRQLTVQPDNYNLQNSAKFNLVQPAVSSHELDCITTVSACPVRYQWALGQPAQV